MSAFRVMLAGGNVVLRVEGVLRRMGFHTTRFVRAGDAEEARAAAVRQAHLDLAPLALNAPDDPAAVSVRAIEAIPLEEVPALPPHGFVWFGDE